MAKPAIAWGVACLVLVALPARADDKASSSFKGDPAELVGAYAIVSGERFGQKEPEERIKGTTVRFSADRVVISDGQKKEVYGASYTLKPRPEGCGIVLTSKLGDSEGQVAKGLIAKDGDTVRLIYALPGGEEPTEFKTKPRQLMFEMKRVGK